MGKGSFYTNRSHAKTRSSTSSRRGKDEGADARCVIC